MYSKCQLLQTFLSISGKSFGRVNDLSIKNLRRKHFKMVWKNPLIGQYELELQTHKIVAYNHNMKDAS